MYWVFLFHTADFSHSESQITAGMLRYNVLLYGIYKKKKKNGGKPRPGNVGHWVLPSGVAARRAQCPSMHLVWRDKKCPKK